MPDDTTREKINIDCLTIEIDELTVTIFSPLMSNGKAVVLEEKLSIITTLLCQQNYSMTI